MRSGSSFYYAKQNSKMISVSLYNLPVSVFSAAGNTGKGWKTPRYSDALLRLDFPHFSLRGARRREIIAK